MKLSVSAWCVEKKLFSGELNIFDFVGLCNENGIKYVELLDCFWKNECDIEQVKGLLEELGMEVSAYSIGNDFVQGDPAERRKQIENVKKGIDVAYRLNARLLRVFSGSSKEGISFDTAKGWIIEGFKEAAEYARKMGITMVLENHGLFAGKSAQVKGLIDEVGSAYLRANTDIGNFMLVNENPLDAVVALKDYISFVHFKDFREVAENEPGYKAIDGRKYQGTVIGEGEVPMEGIVDFLYRTGYKGFLSIEYEGIDDPVSGTVKSIKYAESIVK